MEAYHTREQEYFRMLRKRRIRRRRIALALLFLSALLFALRFSLPALTSPQPSPEPQRTMLPQEIPPAAGNSDDIWTEWVEFEIPGLKDTYFIQRLDEDMQLLCAGIYKGIEAFEEEISLPEPVEEKKLSEVMWLISYDCPELFQISGDYSYYVRENAPDMVLSIKPTYSMGEDAYRAALSGVRSVLSDWFGGCAGLSEYETEKSLYDLIIKNCTYLEEGPYTGTAYGALVLGSARCEGYAKAMCMGLRYAGIESLILTGEARTSASNEETRVEKHAWNIAKINGRYCQLDPTWDDADQEVASGTFYAYLNLTDEEMYRSRSLDEIYASRAVPVCLDPFYSYHRQAGTFISRDQDIEKALQDLLDASFYQEQNYIVGKFETDEQMDEFTEELEEYVSHWYRSKHFRKGAYTLVTYADSRVFSLFDLSYE